MKNRYLWLLVFLATAGASLLRLPDLGQRPMHCDEAVHADKFGTVLEGGGYRYNPTEYHGPTLNYLTLFPAWFRGIHRYQDLDEATLRVIPALFGILLVPFLLLWRVGLGLPSAALAACLLALSPIMTYYSRYYIQEMLLLFFTCGWLVCGYRFFCSSKSAWLICAGIFLGLSHATKETFILALFSSFLSLGICWWIQLRSKSLPFLASISFRWNSLAILAFSAMTVSVLFYSSFFTHPRGVVDSFLAYLNYLERIHDAVGHTHPWYYYLQTLLFFKEPGGPLWTEGFIFIFGCVGLFTCLRGKVPTETDSRLLLFLSLYTTILMVLYSLIDYKTPWCATQFWLGWILLAGVGLNRAICQITTSTGRWLLVCALILAMAHLGWQSWRASYPMDADPRNPFVYAHTGYGVFTVVHRVEALSKAHPAGRGMPIQVYSRENLWPLPWYLRRFPQVRWWNGIVDNAANAPLLLATPDMESAVVRKLYELPPPGERELYMRMLQDYTELRPQVEIQGYVARSLWEDFIRQESESTFQ